MSILDDLFEGDEFDAHQVLADELVVQTLGLIPALVAIREGKNLSQDQVAKRMGISRPGVAQLERRGSNPTLNTVRRYALAMDALLTIDICDGQPWAEQKVREAKDPDLFEKTVSKWSGQRRSSLRENYVGISYKSARPGRYLPGGRKAPSKAGA